MGCGPPSSARAPLKAARPAGRDGVRGWLAGQHRAAGAAAPAPPAAAGSLRCAALPCSGSGAGPMEISLKYLPGGRAATSG